MASVVGHAIAAITFGTAFSKKIKNWKFWLLGIFCSIFPDADVIGFNFGVAYGSFWGHRGFTHSFLFAFIFACFITLIFYRKSIFKKKGFLYILYFFLCTVSHSLLDAMTTGGKGVAFFSPFDNARYFLPWRPIKVSPMGIESFFSEWGLKVIQSELFWIGIPCAIAIILILSLKKWILSD